VWASVQVRLDDVMRAASERTHEVVFNYALSEAQIRTLYNQNSAVRFAPVTGSPREALLNIEQL
jgi:hypothetical protein